MTEKFLSRPEEIVLLAVWKLKENAYGIAIRELIQTMTGKYWSVGAIYVPLERLEKKGLLQSSICPPRKEKGGRRKRHFLLTKAGFSELDALNRMQSVLWKGYPELTSDEGV